MNTGDGRAINISPIIAKKNNNKGETKTKHNLNTRAQMNMELHTRAFGFSKSGMILLKIQSHPSALVYLRACLSSNGKLQKGNARNVKNGASFANLRLFAFILLVFT